MLHYVPTSAGADLDLRVRLHKARDIAAALRGRSESTLASWLACQCHEIAGGMVFAAGLREPQLDVAVQLRRALIRAAMAADSLHSEDFPL